MHYLDALKAVVDAIVDARARRGRVLATMLAGGGLLGGIR